MSKHRLLLISGILVALVFFFLGMRVWMSSTQTEEIIIPPPVAKNRPPVQVRPQPQPQPVEPAPPGQTEPKPPQEAQATEVVKPPPAEPGMEEKGVEPSPRPEVKKREGEIARKEESPNLRKVIVKKKEVRALREYVVQIGAFKFRENARRSLELARNKGFDAFVVEEEGLYKVRVRVKAKSLLSALRKVRGEFRNAFVVR